MSELGAEGGLTRRWVWGVRLTHFALCKRKVSMSPHPLQSHVH